MSDDATIFIGPCQQPYYTGEANISRHLRLIKERETCDSAYRLFDEEPQNIVYFTRDEVYSLLYSYFIYVTF